MNASPIEPVVRDICAHLAAMAHLTHHERLAAAIISIKRVTGHEPSMHAVRAAVFSRSAVHHLGGAALPATIGEAQQFREQARGGFVQLHADAVPHLILVSGSLMLELVHSAQWNDRGVLVRPFVASRPHASTWVVDQLPFGVQVAYSLDPAAAVAQPRHSAAAESAAETLLRAIGSRRAA